MSHNQAHLSPPSYDGGRKITERLLKVTGCSSFNQLAEYFGIPKSTIATWHQREMTPFEIATRTHLSLGVSLSWLLLGEGEMYERGKPSNSTDNVELPYFKLKNGELFDKGKMFFDPQFLEGMPESEHLMLVEYEGQKLFVDTSKNKAISGQYLINIDGDVSLNSMQKLPGNMVAIEFSQSTVQLNEGDVVVVGKVQ
ncbi:hypothetical protein ABT57_14190 [Photobacterium ganghwense]|uniref:Uncharacterized protein n=1 Tax=Photobacterium ganghwense TaxID=320778 RepID=A0A0J1H8G0_9GAMM|nr:phage repressor protein CI [Photobacterium ganghwense]KLV07993.1 hypothetical protein ABT57_14190 [Photobacterium ganghwense]